MKVFNEKDYHYAGIIGNLYVFNKVTKGQDKEMVLVERARLNMLDGTFRYFDPLPTRNEDIWRQLLYACKTGKANKKRTPMKRNEKQVC